MGKFILFFILILSSSTVKAQEEQMLNFLAEKMVTDFQKGLELYNSEKEKTLPEIKKENEIYSFEINKNKIHFSLINYLNNQFYINQKLKSFPSSVNQPKTSMIDFFIKSAHAEDDIDLDGDSTKILLQTLASFSGKLEKAGWTCISSSCKKDVRDKNLKKIQATLKQRSDECAAHDADVTESIARFGRTTSIHSLAFTVSSEFNSVKEFMRKIVNANKKEVVAFMEDNMGIETKPHKTCMQVMVSGTAAESVVSPKGGLSNITRYAAGSGMNAAQESAFNDAKEACVVMEQLKTCLLSLQENTNTINNYKRQAKQTDYDVFPNVKDSFNKGLAR